MDIDYQLALNLTAALVVGLLIGSERGWSGREANEGSRVAGLRTFGIIGVLGGVSAISAQQFGNWLLVSVFAAVAALVVVAHVLDFKTNQDRGTTTAFAMLLTFLLAAWAAAGQQLAALGAAVVVVALLGYKRVLHRWLGQISQQEFSSGVILLLISVVMLPLLPDQGFGPWQALNPYWIWWMVVLISGLSFVGYIAVKLTGARMGVLIIALAGALASSTAVTITLANFCHKSARKHLYIAGILLAGSVMFARVLIEVLVVNPALLSLVILPLGLMGVGMVVAAGFIWRRHQQAPANLAEQVKLPNPLQLKTAMQFGLLLAVILLLSKALVAWFGDSGIYALALASGLIDVDAITLSLSRMATEELAPPVAANGILMAAVVNTLVKGVIFAYITGLKQNIWFVAVLALALMPGMLAGIWIGVGS
ncbi:MgtC/SapB family protein [Pseudohongiella spirulinae]|uniref:Uncharacterized conserved membrane protein n=1 Tax=Pseudohongiella spirulinae TaxID=1249552 RepID=A0A0S2KCM6_9GAMM|nr:MgtC/SapB family protein [Pseudohongiella spirulinae]ALO45743.1 Uncharacterized conserved membrane protein [Pseudohongiella spirulinae]